MVNAANPRGLVVISAHWENEGGGTAVKGMFLDPLGLIDVRA